MKPRRTRSIGALSRLINQCPLVVDETELASQRLGQSVDEILSGLGAEIPSETDITRAIARLKSIEPPVPYLWTRFNDRCLGDSPNADDLRNATRQWIEMGATNPKQIQSEEETQSDLYTGR